MEDLLNRVKNIIDLCWESFSAKVGGGLINVNKEASMQLNFAYILKNSIDLIIHHQIPNIVIGCVDDNPEVAGKGIKKLLDAGRNVKVGVLEAECKAHQSHTKEIQKLNG